MKNYDLSGFPKFFRQRGVRVGAFGQSDIMPRKEKRASNKVVSNCFHAAVKVEKENARLGSNFFHLQ